MGWVGKSWYIPQCTMLLVKQWADISINNIKTGWVRLRKNFSRWLEVEYQGFNMLTCPSHPHEMVQQNKSQSVSDTYSTVFVQSDAAATILCTACFGAASIWGQLLFKGGIYFFGKSAGINDGWIMYIRAIQWWYARAVSSKHNLSVLLSAMEMSCTTQTALALAWWSLSEIICIWCLCNI